jgi:hypothetical protein
MGTGAYSATGYTSYGAAYQHNRVHLLLFDRTNSGAATLNINNLGARPILRDGQQIGQWELTNATYYLLVFDANSGGRFHLLSQGAALSRFVADSFLPGYVLSTATPINANDSIIGAFGKLQAQVNALSGGGGSSRGIKSLQKGEVLGLLSNRDNPGTVVIPISQVVCDNSMIWAMANMLGQFGVGQRSGFLRGVFQGFLPITSTNLVVSWGFAEGGNPSSMVSAQVHWAVVEFE